MFNERDGINERARACVCVCVRVEEEAVNKKSVSWWGEEGHNSRKVIFSQSVSGLCACRSPLAPSAQAVSRV